MTLSEEQKDAFKQIFGACTAGKISDEVSIYEDLYDVDVQEHLSSCVKLSQT